MAICMTMSLRNFFPATTDNIYEDNVNEDGSGPSSSDHHNSGKKFSDMKLIKHG